MSDSHLQKISFGKNGTDDVRYDKIESTLPVSLRESIHAFLKGKEKYESGMGYHEFDMDYCDLQTEINICEVEQMITLEEAWYLRRKYLGLERN